MSRTKKGSNATFTGPQEGLTVIGEHCYAYSGAYAASTTPATVLDFNTNKEYIIGKLFLNGTIESGSGSGEITTAMINFNGVNVSRLKVESGSEDMEITVWNEILIPPLTHSNSRN